MSTQEQLIRLVEEVLEVEGVGANDRFEDVGGNSLTLARLLVRVKEKFGCAPKPRTFFDPSQSTMAHLARAIDELKQQAQSVSA